MPELLRTLIVGGSLVLLAYACAAVLLIASGACGALRGLHAAAHREARCTCRAANRAWLAARWPSSPPSRRSGRSHSEHLTGRVWPRRR